MRHEERKAKLLLRAYERRLKELVRPLTLVDSLPLVKLLLRAHTQRA
jgi:hypothetical protein